MPRNKKMSTRMKKQFTAANTEITEVLELPNKDFKAVIIKILQQVVMKKLETNKKLENLSKEIEDKKKIEFRTEKHNKEHLKIQ